MNRSIYVGLTIFVILTGVSGCSDDDNDTSSDKSGVATEKYTTHILAQGAQTPQGMSINGTVSLNFSPAGEMFVIDAFSSRMLKMNPENGQILSFFTEGVEPADLDFAPDGTMYWMNPFSGEVYKRTTAGEVSRIAELNDGIDGIAVNTEGRVFTASFAAAMDALWELDPYGVQPPRLVLELGDFDAFDFGPDGYLYAPDFLKGTGQIYKIDINSGTYEVVTDGFCQPISTKFNSVGELHVLDYCQKVVKVDIATGAHTLVANLDPHPDNFDFNLQDEMFIAFNADSYIGKVLPDGTVEKITTPGLSSPGSIAIRPDGTLFVADGFSMRRYDAATGEMQQSFYSHNTGMIPPSTLYDDGEYLILSSVLFSGAVQVWDPVANEAVKTYSGFQQPTNAIRFLGDVIVADMGTGSVVKADDLTPLIAGLEVPAGLVARGNDLYVGDRATGTIWKAVESGTRLNPPVAVAEGLDTPEGLAFNSNNKLLVMETGTRRLLEIDIASGDRLVVAEDLEVGLVAPKGAIPTWVAMSSVAVSESGTLYATGDVGNVIYRIEKDADD